MGSYCRDTTGNGYKCIGIKQMMQISGFFTLNQTFLIPDRIPKKIGKRGVQSHCRKPLMVALKDINKCRCSQEENEPIL